MRAVGAQRCTEVRQHTPHLQLGVRGQAGAAREGPGGADVAKQLGPGAARPETQLAVQRSHDARARPKGLHHRSAPALEQALLRQPLPESESM